jgi:hypothetical protein
MPPLQNISKQRSNKFMPNWVHQTLMVTEGNPDDVFEFIRSGNSLFDFNKLIPMPKPLAVERGTKSVVALLCARNEGLSEWAQYPWVQEAGIKTLADLCSHSRWDFDEMVKFGSQLLKNEECYGAQTWYEWRVQHWGSKWPAYDAAFSTDKAGVLHFYTAWSPAFGVYECLAKYLPNHTIVIEAFEPLNDECATIVLKDGEMHVYDDAPHFCPECKHGFGCEDQPCTSAYEMTCKSCIADPVGYVR